MSDTDDIPPPPSPEPDRTQPASPPTPFRAGATDVTPPAHPRYESFELIGAGAMGAVFKCRDRKLDRVVAMKVILGDAGGAAPGTVGQRFRERFEEEGRTLAQLQHPNIVQIHDAGEADGRLFLVMEYVGGGTLEDRLRDRPPTPREAADLTRTLARAVQAAHEAPVVHRDLKPTNILVTADGVLKVADFGLARVLEAADRGQTPESVAGTPGYMAPEQVRGEPLTPRVDIHALGATLYRVLVGQPPFRADSRAELFRKVQSEVPASPRVLRPDVPPDLAAVCLKCLEKNPDNRYPTAAALADDLDRFLGGYPTAARPVGRVARVRMWAARRPARAALAVVGPLALVAAIGSGVLKLQNDVLALEHQLAVNQKTAAEYEAVVKDFAAQAGAAEQQAAPAEVVRAVGWRKGVGDELRALAASSVAATNADRLRDLAAAADNRIDLEEVESITLPGNAHCVAVSPDGKQVAVGQDHTASLLPTGGAAVWLIGPGGTLRQTPVRDGATTGANGIRSLAFSPDGRHLGIGSRGGQVLVWDTTSDRPRKLTPGHKGEVGGVGFTRDGARLVTASKDKTVVLWDAATGDRVLRFDCPPGHTPESVAVTGPTDRVLVGNTRGSWSFPAADLRPGGKFDPTPDDNQIGADRPTPHLAVTPDATRIVSGHGADLLLYDLHLRAWIRWLEDGRSPHAHDANVLGVSIDPTGTLVASGGSDEYLKLWDATSGALLLRLFIPGDSGVIPAFDPATGDLLVVANRRLVRYRVSRPETVRTFGSQKGERVAVAFAGGSDTLATACWATRPNNPGSSIGELAVWRVADGACVARHAFAPTDGPAEWPPSLTADAAGVLVAGGRPGTDHVVWDWQGGGEPRAVPAAEPAGNPQTTLHALAPDGRRLWWVHKDRVTVRAVTWPDRAEVLTKADLHQALAAKRSSCTGLAVGRTWTAVGSVDGTVKLIPAAAPAGDWRVFPAGDRETVHAVALSPDESVVLAGTRSGRVLAFDPAAPGTDPVAVLARHRDRVEAIAFAPAGGLVATAGRDQTIRLWRHEGRAFRPLVGYAATGPVTQLVFSPNGARLAFAVEGQRAVTVWEVAGFHNRLKSLGLDW